MLKNLSHFDSHAFRPILIFYKRKKIHSNYIYYRQKITAVCTYFNEIYNTHMHYFLRNPFFFNYKTATKKTDKHLTS